jgi:hypothetical protein
MLLATAGDKMCEMGSIATVGTEQGNGKRDRLLSEPDPNCETNPISRQRQTRMTIAGYWLPQHGADKVATPTSNPCQRRHRWPCLSPDRATTSTSYKMALRGTLRPGAVASNQYV